MASGFGPPGPTASGFGSNWPSYHGNAEATGVDAAGTDLRPLRPAWTSPTLDGQIYGSPLVADGRVVAATENDTVYVMAADSGHVLWSRHLSMPVPQGDIPCGGDIGPAVGITGSPVVDLARHEVFVVADEFVPHDPASSTGYEASHHLFGLDLFTGKVELDEAVNPNVGEDQLAELQRTALTLDEGNVVFGEGGNDGDCGGPNGPYHGFVFAVPETGGAFHYFEVDNTAPGQSQGAVWMGGAAPVVDPDGNVYVSSGNGSVSDASQTYDDSDSVLELSPTMQLESIFYPSTWASDNAGDADLGVENPTLVDGYVFMVGKTDTAFLMHQGHLGREDGEFDSMPLCGGDPDGGTAVDGSVVYVPCPNGLTAVRISTTAPYMTQLWTDSDGASNGPVVASGLVWTIGGDGAVHGLDPSSGSANHFPTPAVGDGLLLLPGTDQVVAFMGPAGLPPPPPGVPIARAYWVASASGGVSAFGGAANYGSASRLPLKAPVVGVASTPDGRGYWLVASDGGVFSFGDARFHGSTGAMHLNRPIVGIAAAPDGDGYWLVASDGGIFAFGSARYHGSMGASQLNAPIVAMQATPSGGYWMVASDGGIFTFGAARFHGSMGNRHLNSPIAGMAATPTGDGYWMVAGDGGVFTFGDALYRGSLLTSGSGSPAPVVSITSAPDGGGYWMVDRSGVVSAFGDCRLEGSPPSKGQPYAGVAAAR
jgi:outer membrane protein assembly factor BamB